MAGSLNRCEFIGNLGKDPEVKTLQDGGRKVSFSIACSDTWTDKSSGEKKERTEWINVVIWNDGLGKVAENYLKKGSKVYIAGEMQTRKWQDQSGADRYMTEIVLQKFRGELVLLGGKSDSSPSNESRQSAPAQAPSGGAGRSLAEELDDEIPFSCEWR